MKITVDRTLSPEGNLVFTITCKEPHLSTLTEEDTKTLDQLDNFAFDMSSIVSKDVYDVIVKSNTGVKRDIFDKVLDNLRFSIQNEFRPKFQPICQEIYNWIYDYQKGHVKRWMAEFDPQRTTYYFDNDNKSGILSAQEDPDDKIDDEDEDFDEEFDN